MNLRNVEQQNEMGLFIYYKNKKTFTMYHLLLGYSSCRA